MTETIKNTIATFDFGFVFTPKDFPVEPRKQATVNRILNNMVAAGQICRASKGRFYKPKITEFGAMMGVVRSNGSAIFEVSFPRKPQ
ncbi:MAG: hypothetical protein LBN27_02640 [Prevotellaceae bacterium]|jgi:hypothetical protein|nr:hypothetical protein [Prevotellaceae bacterium]